MKIARQTIEHGAIEFDYSDFHDLKNNKQYDRFLAGLLKLSSGRIVCTDPMYRELPFPQTWSVKPGEYPVYLYIGLKDDFEGRVAYAECVFKDEEPLKWQFSLIPTELLDSFERKLNGMYPVENGLSSFSDFETFNSYRKQVDDFYAKSPNGNYYNEVLEPLFKKNASIPESSRGEDWVNYELANEKGNIIMFGTGLGDGLYARYIGYDKDNNPVKMITSFVRESEKTDFPEK